MGKSGFRGLDVWQIAKALAIDVYKITKENRFDRDSALRNQIIRSAISIPSNIAEGDERRTDKEAIMFFYIAKGSMAELITQLEIAHEVGLLEKEVFEDFICRLTTIGKKLGALIKARSRVDNL